jgi:hypothetical protein
MNSKKVSWHGPLSLVENENSVFRESVSEKPGLYLWTVKFQDGYLVNYVGMTKNSIATRLQEHISQFLCGGYWIYDPEQLSQGELKVLYKPSGSVLDFLPRYVSLSQNIHSMLKTYAVFIAEVDGTKEWLERIESGVIKNINKANSKSEAFLDNEKISRFVPEDQRVSIAMHSNEKIIGLSEMIKV